MLSRRQITFGAAAAIGATGIAGLSLAKGDEKTETNMSFDNEWGNLTEAEWKARLTDMEFYVLRKEGTERAGTSPLDDEKRKGTFVCKGCALPLFKSHMKYNSRTGWPSFFDVIDDAVGTKADNKLWAKRTEYHCSRCGGHQGHVFNDGPRPTGLRYCNNGVALDFIPDEA
ncbi:MAG: peptide-methionine (R)-S-oxide reductase MsrB [Hellea sp.]|nr:peptide-methionine (R)-S-oxide reductase MsrB [Hellea sp.]